MRLRRKEFILTCEGHLDQNAMFRRPHGQSVSFLRNHPRDAKKNWTKLVVTIVQPFLSHGFCVSCMLGHCQSLRLTEATRSNVASTCVVKAGT